MTVAAAPARSIKILVAEDDPAVSKLYGAYAQSRGHQVTFARDGAEALVAAAADRPDLILLDVAMPRLDGRDALRALKDNPGTRGIPVLVITAFGGDQSMRDLLLELGAWDVLEKPVDLQIAFNKAERLVRR
jgi:CheY-like chemotaxis protein